jgi:hypothetical protein
MKHPGALEYRGFVTRNFALVLAPAYAFDALLLPMLQVAGKGRRGGEMGRESSDHRAMTGPWPGA